MQRRIFGNPDDPDAIEVETTKKAIVLPNNAVGEKSMVHTLVARPDGLIRNVQETTTISREEKNELLETEDVKHFGDFSDEVSSFYIYIYNVLHLMNNWYWNISHHLTYSACSLTYTTPPPTHYTNFKTTWILCSISFTLPPTHFSYPQQRKITHNKSKKWTQFCDLQLLLHFIYISNAQFSISSHIFTLK